MTTVEQRMTHFEAGAGNRDRTLFGYVDEDGFHPGILQVLTEGLKDVNRELADINHRLATFVAGGRGVLRWLLGALGSLIAVSAWWITQHSPQIAKALGW